MFQVAWRSIRDFFDDMLMMVLTNIVWCAISVPLLALAFFSVFQDFALIGSALALLGVLPLGPATAGLYTIAERTIEGRTSKMAMFFAAMKEYAQLSWKVYGIWMFGFITILFNLRFYGGWNNTLGAFLQIVFIYLILIWFGVLMYIGPLMLLQTDKSIKIIARNTALMVLGRPVFTLVTVILMVLMTILSILPGVFLLPGLMLFSLLAVWSLRATSKLIKDAEERRRLAQEQAATGSGPVYSSEKGRGGQIKPRK